MCNCVSIYCWLQLIKIYIKACKLTKKEEEDKRFF